MITIKDIAEKCHSILPCFPCPHNSICCSWGASLTEKEALQIKENHGECFIVWDEEEQGFRTCVQNDRCVFLKDNQCTIHEEDYYPQICRGFPYTDGEGNEYQYTKTICPEFEV